MASRSPKQGPAHGRGACIAWFFALFAAVVAVDQVTKWFLRDYLANGSVTLIPGVLDLSLVYNEGAAFGMGAGGTWVFVVLAALIACACAAYVVAGKATVPLSAVLGVVAGGGVGNLIDRVSQGAVTDFFKTTFVDFAVFNVADIAITCGFVVAFILFWRQESVADGPDGGEDGEGDGVS